MSYRVQKWGAEPSSLIRTPQYLFGIGPDEMAKLPERPYPLFKINVLASSLSKNECCCFYDLSIDGPNPKAKSMLRGFTWTEIENRMIF